ncbi:hypothetical protein HZA39_01595 [Candidatus Peregrinibacteria bacterium]|nr:hypothetical protein [Candidatus Peregrinibacteria bacterium]
MKEIFVLSRDIETSIANTTKLKRALSRMTASGVTIEKSDSEGLKITAPDNLAEKVKTTVARVLIWGTSEVDISPVSANALRRFNSIGASLPDSDIKQPFINKMPKGSPNYSC